MQNQIKAHRSFSVLTLMRSRPRQTLPLSKTTYNALVASLNAKTAVITGGAVHLGRAIALAMADAGAHVAFTFLDSKDEASQTLAEIKKRGRQAMAVPCD